MSFRPTRKGIITLAVITIRSNLMSATIGDTGAYITIPGRDTVIGAYILLTDISPHMSIPTRRMDTILLMDTIHTGITRISVGLGSSTGGGTRARDSMRRWNYWEWGRRSLTPPPQSPDDHSPTRTHLTLSITRVRSSSCSA